MNGVCYLCGGKGLNEETVAITADGEVQVADMPCRNCRGSGEGPYCPLCGETHGDSPCDDPPYVIDGPEPDYDY